MSRYECAFPLAAALYAALGASACTGQLGSVAETGDDIETTDADDADDVGTLPIPEPCVDGTCSDGFECRAGECLPACTASGLACPGGYQCDASSGLCQRDPIVSCPCESPQFCTFGSCTSPPRDANCDPTNPLESVCTPYELCIDTGDVDGPEMTQCWEMPACPADGACPVGTLGAVCNEDLIVGKERVCLIGYCLDVEDCPSSWHCVDTGTAIGVCSAGTLGSPCSDNGDCDSSNCVILLPGTPGFCG